MTPFRRFAIVALAAVALLSFAPLAPNSSLINSGFPPVRYQGDAAVAAIFVSDLRPYCGNAPPGYQILGCAIGQYIFMPSPCPSAATQQYAKILCHEIGHTKGWPRTHGD